MPPGFVRTYGDVSPGAPRVAGAVLSACKDETVPWHRIVRADGSLTQGARQRALLDAEGVPFRGSRVAMSVARLPELVDPSATSGGFDRPLTAPGDVLGRGNIFEYCTLPASSPDTLSDRSRSTDSHGRAH